MAKIRAFKGVRPNPALAEQVISKPYDVLNSAEARNEIEGNPHSFLRIVKSEVDFPAEQDQYAQAVYDKARDNFNDFLEGGTLIQDGAACLYVYEQQMGSHVQAGIVAASSVQDYWDNVIKKHEFTRPVKEQDRINHISTMGVQTGPIFLTYPDHAAIDAIVAKVKEGEPEYNLTTEDEVRHTMWVVNDAETVTRLEGLFANEVPFTYIADGHHRTASAAKVGKKLQKENPNHTGDEGYNFFLSVIFPASQLMVIDYNRLVKDLKGQDKAGFLQAINEQWEVSEKGSAIYKPQSRREFSMYLDNTWYLLTPKSGTYPDDDPVDGLDVAILQNNLLAPVLGIEDPRRDNRIDFVGGIRGLGELEKRVNSGEMEVAFALYPVSIEELIRIADSGNVMPPKSTWFEPKLRSGMVSHKFG